MILGIQDEVDSIYYFDLLLFILLINVMFFELLKRNG